MKLVLFCAAGLGLLSSAASHAQNVEPPPSKELQSVRESYEASVATATKPLKDRYIQQLEQMKRGAMSSKNLRLAAELDQEIKRLSGPPAATAVKTADDLTRYLAGTTWSWGRSIGSADSRLSFKADGTCAINNDPPVRWIATGGSALKLENGTVIKFSGNNKAYTAETAAGPRVGVRLEQ